MMEILLDTLSWVLLISGSIFAMIGGIGMIRLPDVYARMHAAGITDTLGAGLILAGLMVQGGFTLVTVKLAMILIFLLYTSPTSTYAVANSAFRLGLDPKLGAPKRADPKTEQEDNALSKP